LLTGIGIQTKAAYKIMSTDAGLTNITIGYRAAACSRLMALPLTSNIQCLPCNKHHPPECYFTL